MKSFASRHWRMHTLPIENNTSYWVHAMRCLDFCSNISISVSWAVRCSTSKYSVFIFFRPGCFVECFRVHEYIQGDLYHPGLAQVIFIYLSPMAIEILFCSLPGETCSDNQNEILPLSVLIFDPELWVCHVRQTGTRPVKIATPFMN